MFGTLFVMAGVLLVPSVCVAQSPARQAVVEKGFVIQTGHLPSRKEPLGERQQSFVRPMKAEFSAQALDGRYTAFGKVESGMEVVQAIESVQVNGEAPVERVELLSVRVLKP